MSVPVQAQGEALACHYPHYPDCSLSVCSQLSFCQLTLSQRVGGHLGNTHPKGYFQYKAPGIPDLGPFILQHHPIGLCTFYLPFCLILWQTNFISIMQEHSPELFQTPQDEKTALCCG